MRSLAVVCLLAACDPTIPDDVFACTQTSECPPGFVCSGGFCRNVSVDGGVDAGLDAAIADAGRDAGTDAGLRDGGDDAGPDAGCTMPPFEPTACTTDAQCGGLTCVGGACVDDCGDPAWLAGLDTSLDPRLHVQASFCVPAPPSSTAIGTRVTTREGCPSVDIVMVSAARPPGTRTDYTVSRWTMDERDADPTLTTVASPTSDVPDMAIASYLGSYLAVSPSGTYALFGYTTSAPGFAGEILRVRLADGVVHRADANGNYDATWLDDDHALVVAQFWFGFTQPALYLLEGGPTSFLEIFALAANFGRFNGAFAVADPYDTILLGGFVDMWPDTSSGGKIFAVPTERLLDGTMPVEADEVEIFPDGVIRRFNVESSFRRVGNHLVYSEGFPGTAQMRDLGGTSAGDMTAGPAQPIGDGALLGRVIPIDERRALFASQRGILLVTIDP
jgi:hypothetical protein